MRTPQHAFFIAGITKPSGRRSSPPPQIPSPKKSPLHIAPKRPPARRRPSHPMEGTVGGWTPLELIPGRVHHEAHIGAGTAKWGRNIDRERDYAASRGGRSFIISRCECLFGAEVTVADGCERGKSYYIRSCMTRQVVFILRKWHSLVTPSHPKKRRPAMPSHENVTLSKDVQGGI